MPNATIYIRKEDFDRWVAIENKSEWLHNQLAQLTGVLTEAYLDEQFNIAAGAGIAARIKPIPNEMQPKFCKEGHPIPYGRDKCLGKGCKYS